VKKKGYQEGKGIFAGLPLGVQQGNRDQLEPTPSLRKERKRSPRSSKTGLIKKTVSGTKEETFQGE